MKYVPNLIPEHHKVLPDYFKGNIHKAQKKRALQDTISWIAGSLMLIIALGWIANHPILTLIYGLIGFILIPPGHRWIERKLRFSLTGKIKTVAISVLFLTSFPLIIHYAETDKENLAEQKIADEKAASERKIADQKEQLRKDSLAFYLQQSSLLAGKHKLEDANKQLQYAAALATLPSEKAQIEQEKNEIAINKVIDLVDAGKYLTALPEINDLLLTNPSNPSLILNRAICYSKTGNLQEAVNDLKPLVQAGNLAAEKLNNKINPLRKRVAYYVTRCRDGSTSNAKGRGACSHHGGVANWNEPVYEEYRKYD